jgi:hypothetical protein
VWWSSASSPISSSTKSRLGSSRSWERITVASKRSRRFTVMPSSKARDSVWGYCSKSNLVKKPREPSENARTGGTMRWNSQDEYNTVPSPPSYVLLVSMCRNVQTVLQRARCRMSGASAHRARWSSTLIGLGTPGSSLAVLPRRRLYSLPWSAPRSCERSALRPEYVGQHYAHCIAGLLSQ